MPDIVGYDHDQLEEARSNPETEVPAPFSNVFENVPLTVDERERKDEGKPGNSIDHSNEFEGLDLEAIPPYSRNEEQAKDLSNAIELDRVDAHDEELHDSSNEIKKGVILEEQVSRDTSEAFDASALPPRLTKKLFRGLRALVPDDYHAKLHDLEIASIRVLDELSGWSREVDAEVRDGRVVLFLWLGEVWSKTVEQAQVARDTAKQIWRTNEDLRIVCRNVAGLIALLLSGAAFATCYLVVSWIPSFLLNFYRGFDVVTRAQLQIFSCLIVLLLLYRVRALLMFWVVAALSAAYYYWSGHVVIEVRFT
ncbi:TPA: hypothetical protein N0F65_006436 [Lagenidium giganteum]|uniref:Uncharacterized protein n=1 Tax=Lagenidium giganteum TaxID=4803 RepID=A0AAV2Z1J3_9STRA|nr:TPA: hypothetical protein N0F65_006436 [Lagenidium giganteum]